MRRMPSRNCGDTFAPHAIGSCSALTIHRPQKKKPRLTAFRRSNRGVFGGSGSERCYLQRLPRSVSRRRFRRPRTRVRREIVSHGVKRRCRIIERIVRLNHAPRKATRPAAALNHDVGPAARGEAGRYFSRSLEQDREHPLVGGVEFPGRHLSLQPCILTVATFMLLSFRRATPSGRNTAVDIRRDPRGVGWSGVRKARPRSTGEACGPLRPMPRTWRARTEQ